MNMKISLEKLVASLPSGQRVYDNPQEYDLAIAHHPYFNEMKARIFEFANQHLSSNSRILEYGAGTGNLTEVLAKLPFVHFLVTEDDEECFEYLKNKLGSNSRLAFGRRDITQDSDDKSFDAIFACVVDHHIPPDQKINYLRIILSQLRPGGYFIVGEELIDEYSDEASRIESLKGFHGAIIQECIENGHFGMAKIESLALKNGIDSFDEYKISKNQYVENIRSVGFDLILAEKMGPNDGHDHGVYVVIAQKPILD